MKILKHTSVRVKNHRIVNLLVAGLYLWFYDFVFKNYIAVLFDTPYFPMDEYMQCWYYISGILPMFFYKGLKTVASLFSIFVYIFAYIPFNESLSVCGYKSDFDDYRIVFFIFMCLFFMTDNIGILNRLFHKKATVSYKSFKNTVFAVLFIVVLLNFRNLHFTNFITNRDDLYDLRENLNIIGGSIVVYLIYWLKNILLPIVFVCSLIIKDRKSLFIAFVGSMLMYMIDQQKITFVAPFVIYGLYCLYALNPKFIRYYFHILIMGALIVIPFFCFIFMYYSDTLYEIASIVIMRTQCIEGMELNTYFNWFGHSGKHPYTYYSHIGVVDAITGAYPYDIALGKVVTNHGSNANGMFWLMDGIAAAGLYGCIIISVLFIFVKSLFNGIGHKCKVELFAIFSLFAMSMTMNVSLFTALMSCGLLLVYILFMKVDFYMLANRKR